jgi:hypothetical protein
MKAGYRRMREAQAARMGGRRLNPAPWLRDALRVEPLVEKIRARGGDVVFVKFPFCEEATAFSDRWYPKAHFWDAFARQTDAHTLHYQDGATLGPLRCPDTSHVDARDAPRVTSWLLGELERRQLLPR